MKPDWRQIILYVTVMGTEGCWLYALVAMLNEKIASGCLSVLGLLLLYLASFGFNLNRGNLRLQAGASDSGEHRCFLVVGAAPGLSQS